MLCLGVPVSVSIHNKLPFSVSLCVLEMTYFSEQLTVKICELRSAIFPLKIIHILLINILFES